MATTVFSGSDGTISVAVESGPAGEKAKAVVDKYALTPIGRATGVTVRVTNSVKPFNELGQRFPTELRSGNLDVHGTIERAYVNGALLKLMLGDAADNRPAGTFVAPTFNLTLQHRNPAQPDVSATVTVMGVQLQEWNYTMPEDDFVMVSVNGMEQDPFGDLLELSPAFKPPKKKPAPKDPNSPVDSVVADVQKAFLADRILRFAKVVKIPTGPPDPRKGGAPPTTEINVPFIGDEAEWTKDIDTDDDHRASEVARAMFLRVAATNALDANDLLGMIDPHVRDPARKDPTKSVKRAADATDTPNPLAVKDIVKEVGVGKVKKCQLTAYASEVVGRMGTIAYQPDVLDYTFFYEVKVEDLPGEKK